MPGDRSSMASASGGGGGGMPPMYVNHHALHGNSMMQQAMANAVHEHGANNFATIRTTSIVTKQQKEHMQEEMHEQMSGYKRMRREHQALLLKLEEKCKVEMEQHKGALDKEYDALLTNFTRELERLAVRHQQELERRVKQNNAAEKKLGKEIALKQENERKLFDVKKKKEYKANKERWKRELSQDESTPKRLRDATLQSQKDNLKQAEAQEEQRLLRVQKHYIELEMRKFKRRKMMMLQELENQLFRDVSGSCSWVELVNLYLIISLSCLSGVEQETAAAGAGARDPAEAPREDAGAGVPATEERAQFARGTDYQAARVRVAEPDRLLGPGGEGADAETCGRTEATTQESKGECWE